VIYGTPHKYRKGLRLPEGEYRVVVKRAGFVTQDKTVTVKENALATENFFLEKIASTTTSNTYEAEEKVERISVIGRNIPSSEKQKKTNEVEEPSLSFLTIKPTLEHVTYLVESNNGERFTYSGDMTLPAGEYQALAVDKSTGKQLQVMAVTLVKDAKRTLVFDNRKLAPAMKVDAEFIFSISNFHRERITFTLTDQNGTPYAYTKRAGRRGFTVEDSLMEGEYKAEISGRNIKVDLGEIELSRDKSNSIEFVLE
jgi:hypothetical protein